MAAEQDQSSWLPEPPPPRPARRDAAIHAALRKFDGLEVPAPAVDQAPRRSWASAHRPQLAALVSVMLIVVVGIPVALIGLRNNQPPTPESAPPPLARYEAPAARAPAIEQKVAEAPPPRASFEEPPPPPLPPRKDQAHELQAANGAPAAETAPSAVVAAAPPSASAPQLAAAPPPPPPPAPPTQVASRGSETQSAARDIVISGTRIANPALGPSQGFAAKATGRAADGTAGVSSSYRSFLSRLQAAVQADDRRAVINLIASPLRVNSAQGTRLYRDRRSVEADFDRIFTPKVRRAILNQQADQLFVRDQGAMIGNGEVWFSETCANAACPPTGPVRIVAVNL